LVFSFHQSTHASLSFSLWQLIALRALSHSDFYFGITCSDPLGGSFQQNTSLRSVGFFHSPKAFKQAWAFYNKVSWDYLR